MSSFAFGQDSFFSRGRPLCVVHAASSDSVTHGKSTSTTERTCIGGKVDPTSWRTSSENARRVREPCLQGLSCQPLCFVLVSNFFNSRAGSEKASIQKTGRCPRRDAKRAFACFWRSVQEMNSDTGDEQHPASGYTKFDPKRRTRRCKTLLCGNLNQNNQASVVNSASPVTCTGQGPLCMLACWYQTDVPMSL